MAREVQLGEVNKTNDLIGGDIMLKILFCEVDTTRDTFTLIGVEIFGVRAGIEFSLNVDRAVGQSEFK